MAYWLGGIFLQNRPWPLLFLFVFSKCRGIKKFEDLRRKLQVVGSQTIVDVLIKIGLINIHHIVLLSDLLIDILVNFVDVRPVD